MTAVSLQTIFRRLLNMIPNIGNEDYWIILVNENKIDQLTSLINVLDDISTNRDGSLNNPDLIWILNNVTSHLGFYVYGHTTSDLDNIIFRITRNRIKTNKNVAFFAYSSHVFSGDHKENLIREIINSRYADYVIGEYIKLFYSQIDEINYWGGYRVAL